MMPHIRPVSYVVQVILASQSPRRRDLLNLIGIRHAVRPANVDESVISGETPLACAERLARAKAARIAADEPGALVIAADTVVVIDDRILGKPVDRDDARAMLRSLQGRPHTVYSAVCVSFGARIASGVEAVRVQFRAITDAD